MQNMTINTEVSQSLCSSSDTVAKTPQPPFTRIHDNRSEGGNSTLANTMDSRLLRSSLDTAVHPSHATQTVSNIRRRNRILYADPFTSLKEDFQNELLQRSVAWILLGKGIHEVDSQCLEYGASWIGLKIEQLGQLAKSYAGIRGVNTVNYVDMKRSVRDECRDLYYLMFVSMKLPTSGPLPKMVPSILPSLGITSVNSSWMVNDAMTNENIYSTSQKPSYVHSHMPMFPPKYMYSKSPVQWETTDERSMEFTRNFQKMEMQMQLPQLQASQLRGYDLEMKEAGAFEDKFDKTTLFWGHPRDQSEMVTQKNSVETEIHTSSLKSNSLWQTKLHACDSQSSQVSSQLFGKKSDDLLAKDCHHLLQKENTEFYNDSSFTVLKGTTANLDDPLLERNAKDNDFSSSNSSHGRKRNFSNIVNLKVAAGTPEDPAHLPIYKDAKIDQPSDRKNLFVRYKE